MTRPIVLSITKTSKSPMASSIHTSQGRFMSYLPVGSGSGNVGNVGNGVDSGTGSGTGQLDRDTPRMLVGAAIAKFMKLKT